MATTTNFGWETPDDTDLVKDGAAAIRTALGGVDTSFVDLKGGTTGQFLTKASGTDLDFSWGGAWTTWTPTLGSLTLGNGTITARYQKVGKTVNYYFKFLFGSTSSVTSGAYFTLPTSTAQTHLPGQVLMRDSGTGWWFGACIIDTGYAYINNQKVSTNFTTSESITATTPFTWTTNDFIVVNGTYEEA